jgi:Ser/Thr protein kinase RdoA (MazF antagonist)
VIAELEAVVGAPVVLRELKLKPGRRRTLHATGSAGNAIVKVYASGRAATVAARVAALAGGPSQPRLPEVLLVDPALRLVVLSEVPGVPLRVAILDGDAEACRRAGTVLAGWHGFWRDRGPAALSPHTAERELELLRAHAGRAPTPVAAAVEASLAAAAVPWGCSTVVHRDLYEEQVLLGDEVGLIDLDDAALGPPELDVGNLLAHVDLLGRRSGRDLAPMQEALLSGYSAGPAPLDAALLDRCRRLSLLRLACIHSEPALVELARDPATLPAAGL